jgi:hypothetical protein
LSQKFAEFRPFFVLAAGEITRRPLPAKAARALCPIAAPKPAMRLRPIKIAARVVEGVARIRVRLPMACPDRAIAQIR